MPYILKQDLEPMLERETARAEGWYLSLLFEREEFTSIEGFD
jgi:hypothetical protein